MALNIDIQLSNYFKKIVWVYYYIIDTESILFKEKLILPLFLNH